MLPDFPGAPESEHDGVELDDGPLVYGVGYDARRSFDRVGFQWRSIAMGQYCQPISVRIFAPPDGTDERGSDVDPKMLALLCIGRGGFADRRLVDGKFFQL